MDLIDIINRPPVPSPDEVVEKIPWNDPGFSQRMLREHLSQEHDAASRRLAIVEQHVAWIHHFVLRDQPTRILDLGCGPGLYASRLARLGHDCTGIDFSPASIAYAVQRAREENLRCSYIEQDVRQAEYGHGFGLAMLVFGEFNAFYRTDARLILEKAHRALAEKGTLLLEVHTFAAVRGMGDQPPAWYSAGEGLFSDRPHICLTENFWDPQQELSTRRFFIIDGLTGRVARYAENLQAYTGEQYRRLLEECGFREIVFHPSLAGIAMESQSDLQVIVCRK